MTNSHVPLPSLDNNQTSEHDEKESESTSESETIWTVLETEVNGSAFNQVSLSPVRRDVISNYVKENSKRF